MRLAVLATSLLLALNPGISPDDHRFSGSEAELKGKLLDAIEWIKAQRR